MRLLRDRFLRRASRDDRARPQVRRRAQHAFPQIVGSRDDQPYGLSFFFGKRQHFGKKQLLDRGEQLIRGEIVFARCRPAQQPHVQNHNFRLPALGSAQSSLQRIERVLRAHRNQDISGLNAHVLRRQIRFLRQVELIELDAAFPAAHARINDSLL